ncbi:cytidine deaminase-like protein [Polyporus arcularius HHB13444]|uniref:Cytosine deaminase n=1 Tax=Polyporus arcularius HHB13444 TaxID=1314778 RepID=A0A5C3PEP5_9APHY|nr:cytidine deaminase-like protein [Polyporus arcularius HHB13444]
MSLMTSASAIVAADKLGMDVAFENARKSYGEGGVPIGAALVYHGPGGEEPRVVGQGHNQRIQKSSPILHGEMAALENAGRLKSDVYRNSTMYTTLSPCSMCTGAILLYKIPRVVIGENVNFSKEEDLLRSRGVEVVVLEDERCTELMGRYIREKPEDWYEDIGETAV